MAFFFLISTRMENGELKWKTNRKKKSSYVNRFGLYRIKGILIWIRRKRTGLEPRVSRSLKVLGEKVNYLSHGEEFRKMFGNCVCHGSESLTPISLLESGQVAKRSFHASYQWYRTIFTYAEMTITVISLISRYNLKDKFKKTRLP